MITKVLLFLVLILNSQLCFAKNGYKFTVGMSYIYANINYSDVEFINDKEMLGNPNDQWQTVSIGLSKSFGDNFNISIATNRLFDNDIERSMKIKHSNMTILSKSKTTIDSLSLGYQVNRFNPSLVLMNIEAEKLLYFRNNLIGQDNKKDLVKGINVGYFTTRNLIPSFTYIFQSEKLNLESAFSLNLTYSF